LSLRLDVEFYKKLLREYTISGKAYGKNGIKSYRDYKLYASLARKAFEISSIFSNTIESLIISINSSQGKPNFSEIFDALYKGIKHWNQFQKNYKAIQYGGEKIKRKFEEETFRWIAGGIAYAVSNAWYERAYKLKKEGLENTGNYRQAVAEYKRWKGFMEKTQLFESNKPILMKRTFWRAWDWIPAPYKTDKIVKIEN
jgi:hypothetical protein